MVEVRRGTLPAGKTVVWSWRLRSGGRSGGHCCPTLAVEEERGGEERRGEERRGVEWSGVEWRGEEEREEERSGEEIEQLRV